MASLAGVMLIAGVLPATVRSQSAPAPMEVVRLFCQADGRGDRVHPRRWAVVAPLVTWTLEPAWDRVWLISGYHIHPPRLVADQDEPRPRIEIAVEYTLVGHVSAAGAEDAQRLETVTLVLVGDDTSGWRIEAPPPPPHVFANQADAAAMRRALDPESADYLSASAFVWRMLTNAGWPVPYRPVDKLRDPEVFAAVEEPQPGDLALFLANDVPYHVGIVTGDDEIASATVNAGLMRTSPEAFAGTVLHLRLRAPLTPRAASGTAAEETPGTDIPAPAAATARRTPVPRATPAPTGRVKKHVRPPKQKTSAHTRTRPAKTVKSSARRPPAVAATPRQLPRRGPGNLRRDGAPAGAVRW